MSANSARAAGVRAGSEGRPGPEALLSWPGRLLGGLSAAVGTVAGITPHVLHHIGPIAGAAILTGSEGSALFGAIGFALTLPMLIRLKKRFDSWAAPGVALALFAIMFTISTLWIGPAIRGDNADDEAAPTDPHHTSISSPASGGGFLHAKDAALLSTKERA